MALLIKTLCFYQVYREMTMWLAEEEIGGGHRYQGRMGRLRGTYSPRAGRAELTLWMLGSKTMKCVLVCLLFRMRRGSQCMRTDESK
jgi:hypothetical protein